MLAEGSTRAARGARVSSLAKKAAAEVGATLEPEKPVRVVRTSDARVGVFSLAKDVPTESVLSRLGFAVTTQGEKSFTTCVHCKNDDSLICKPNGGTACFHDTCREAGSTEKTRYRSNVEIVAEQLGVTPIDAAKKICEWEGIKVPERRRTERDLDGENEPDLTDAFGPGEPPEWMDDDESHVATEPPTAADPLRGLPHLAAVALIGRERILDLAAKPI